MKKVHWLMFVVACCTCPTLSYGQNSFQHCTAAFVGNKMVVDQYTTNGKSVLPAAATGELSVQTVDLSPTSAKALDKIAFKVAIRDKATKTLVMYSSDEYKQVSVQNVLAKCQKGDHIVLLTVDNQYALPHNEILVQ